MFNFFWRVFGYKTEVDKNEEKVKEIEEKYKNFDEFFEKTELELQEKKENEEIKEIKIEEPVKIKNFEKFYLDYVDDILNKDELSLIHDNMDMDNIIFNIGKNYQESKYEEFMIIVNQVKKEKKMNSNLLLTGIYSLFNDDNFFEKKYVYTFTYDKFETFYNNWEEIELEGIKLKYDELEVIFENLKNLSYNTLENKSKFSEIKRILDKVLRRKLENGNKRLYKVMYLGTTFPDEYDNVEPKNIYKLFFE
jgi:hypothetical protein